MVDWEEGAVLYSDSTAGVIASIDIETMTNTTLLSSLSNPGALALHSNSSSRFALHVPKHTHTACKYYQLDAIGESEQAPCSLYLHAIVQQLCKYFGAAISSI